MTCKLDITDIVNVYARSGTVDGVNKLTADQTAGVLAALLRTVNQDADVISAKGLGLYGLFLRDLQLTGIVKKGISASINPAMIPTVIDPNTGLQSLADAQPFKDLLADQSVFTGKDGVNNVGDLLADGTLQQKLTNTVMIKNIDSLETEGLITGNETIDELSGLAGVAAMFSLSDIKSKITGLLDPAFAAVNVAMDAVGAISAFGAALSTVKSMDITGKLKGFGAAIVSLPELATDTIDLADTNAGVDSIIGSARLQSESVLSSADGALASANPDSLL